MWKNRLLKQQGRAAFRRNYWRAVLAGLLVLSLAGAAGVTERVTYSVTDDNRYEIGYTGQLGQESQSTDPEGWTYKDSFSDPGTEEQLPAPGELPQLPDKPDDSSWSDISPKELAVRGLLGAIAGVLAIAVTLLLRIYIGNPLSVGCSRFFLMNLRQEPGEIREIGYAFDHNWGEAGRIMFARDVKLILWSLLFVIPGIVKSYEYRMIPYILAEEPAVSRKEAFALSKALMKGCKWRAFLLDLSFLGWDILSVVTLGMVGIFYAFPYQLSTRAALYAHLRYGSDE